MCEALSVIHFRGVRVFHACCEFLAVPISVPSEQGYAEAIFFGFLAPIQFFVGLLMGAAGSVFLEWFIHRIRRSEK